MSFISLFILHFVSFDEGFQASFPASPRKDLLAALFQKIAGPFIEMNNRFLSAETFILFLPCRTDPSRFHQWQPWADSHLSPFWDLQEFSLFRFLCSSFTLIWLHRMSSQVPGHECIINNWSFRFTTERNILMSLKTLTASFQVAYHIACLDLLSG